MSLTHTKVFKRFMAWRKVRRLGRDRQWLRRSRVVLPEPADRSQRNSVEAAPGGRWATGRGKGSDDSAAYHSYLQRGSWQVSLCPSTLLTADGGQSSQISRPSASGSCASSFARISTLCSIGTIVRATNR